MTHPDQPRHPNQAYVLTDAGAKLSLVMSMRMSRRLIGTGSMASSKQSGRIGRLFRHPSGQDELFEKSYEEELEARRGDPVACLGLNLRERRGAAVSLPE